jgi:PAS domain S-box-containing protein
LREGTTLNHYEDVFVRKDGSFFDVVYSSSAIREGERITGLVVVFRDITEQKRAEEALRESEERVRLATETGKIGLWAWDIPNNRVSWTDAIYSIHGLTKEEFDGTAEAFAQLVHSEDRSRVSQAIERSLKEGVPYEITFRAVRPSGEVIWIFTNAVVVRTNGQAVRMLGATTDVTELKKATEALQLAKRQVEEASRAKDQFLAMLSHELRTPLTPVLMAASALERDPTVGAQLREQFTMMRRNIELEARLIDDLLDVTRIAHGKFDLRTETVDIHDALEHAISISAADVLNKNLELTKRLQAVDHYCLADGTRLQEVFWNVLRNAVKFTPEGGKITISTRNDDHQNLVIEFSDTGPGIDPQLQSRIFDIFEQGDKSSGAGSGGLGLGLAISKRIIDLHHGAIAVQSDGPGAGATFIITLQAIKAPPGNTATQKPEPAFLASAPAKILVVEDHTDTGEVLRRILQGMSYDVTLSKTLRNARALAAQQNFDLLISDIGLPDGSGLELMRDFQERQKISGIALSGFGAQEDVAASAAAGFAVHLTKPIDLDQLRRAIAQLLDTKGVAVASR